MIFPETTEDVELIMDTYGMTDEDLEEWIDMLTEYVDGLKFNSSLALHIDAEELDALSEEARNFSEECSELSQELSARVKYDVNVAIFAEMVAWECSVAAGLAEEFEKQADDLRRAEDALREHCDTVTSLRDLLRKYLSKETEEVSCEDYSYEDEWD